MATYAGHVDARGRLEPASRAWLEHALTQRPGPITLTVSRARGGASAAAKRYYFGVVVRTLAEHCDYDADELHELLAFKFLRCEDDPVTGSPRRHHLPDTTSAAFATYVDDCIRFATSLGAYIPAPGEETA